MTDTTTQAPASAACPECAAELSLASDLMQGEILACDDCGSELEVTSLEPVQLMLAPEVQEDWGE